MRNELRRPALLLDLDGTLTELEILPAIAELVGVGPEMTYRTARAMSGLDDFQESFRERLALLESIPLVQVKQVVREIPLRKRLLDTAQNWPGHVAVVTSNLDIWVHDLLSSVGLPYFSSKARYSGGLVVDSILDKAAVVRAIEGPVIFVGDGANDVDAVSAADIGVAFGVGRKTPDSLLRAADIAFSNEGDLCRFLQQF